MDIVDDYIELDESHRMFEMETPEFWSKIKNELSSCCCPRPRRSRPLALQLAMAPRAAPPASLSADPPSTCYFKAPLK